MWRVIKNTCMCDITQSAVLLEGEISEPFGIGQGVAQGCSMSPTVQFLIIRPNLIIFPLLLISC